MAAAVLVPGSEVILGEVMTNPLRTGLITTLREMAPPSRWWPSAATAARR